MAGSVDWGQNMALVPEGWRWSLSSFSYYLCLETGYLTSLGLSFLLCKAGI